MSSEGTGETVTVTTEGAPAAGTAPAPAKGEWKVRVNKCVSLKT